MKKFIMVLAISFSLILSFLGVATPASANTPTECWLDASNDSCRTDVRYYTQGETVKYTAKSIGGKISFKVYGMKYHYGEIRTITYTYYANGGTTVRSFRAPTNGYYWTYAECESRDYCLGYVKMDDLD